MFCSTLAVNLVGAFLVGLIAGLPFMQHPVLTAGAVVGFLGGLTTFSTFSLDTLALLETGRPGWALANAFASVVLGFGLVALGLWLGRQLV